MSHTPLTTIVIPVHNREAVVMRTLESVAAQSSRNFRVVLVDNASTDGTLDVLRAWADAGHGLEVTVLTEATSGATAARNRGLQAATTEWIMFFDSDDVMLPGHVARFEHTLARHPDADIIGWDVEYRALDGSIRRLEFFDRDTRYHNLFHGMMATHRYAVRTSLIRAAGGWDPTVKAWNDVEVGDRLLQLPGIRIHHAGHAPGVIIHASEISITGSCYSSHVGDFEHALRVMSGSLPPLWISVKRAILAATCTKEGSAEGERLMRDTYAECTNLRQKAICGFAYHYTRHGLRGAARLLRPLL